MKVDSKPATSNSQTYEKLERKPNWKSLTGELIELPVQGIKKKKKKKKVPTLQL